MIPAGWKPAQRAYRALLDDLAGSLDLHAGLAAIVGSTPDELPAPDDHPPFAAQHQRLIGDLTAAMSQVSELGLAAILTEHGPAANLAEELAATLNLEQGLAAALTGGPIVIPAAPIESNRSQQPALVDELAPLVDALMVLYRAPASRRLQMRAGVVHRALRQGILALTDIRNALSQVHPDPAAPLPTLQDTQVALDEQHRKLIHLTAILAATQPASQERDDLDGGRPEPDTSNQDADRALQADRVLWGLAELREKAGDHAGAEALAVEAADRGDTVVLVYLAALREKAGDHAGAEALIMQAADRGDTRALGYLAALREKAGDHAGAEALIMQAAQRGDTNAMAWLAELREKAGDHAGAEALAVHAAERGDTNAMAWLAELREKAGDHAGAEALAVHAAQRGNTNALALLAALREKAGDHAGAEALAVQTADHSGETSARLIDQAVRHGEADSVASARPATDPLLTAAALIKQQASELNELRERVAQRPPISAGERELAACRRTVIDLARVFEALWQVLSDFRGSDLHSVAGLTIENLDGVTWSDNTTEFGATSWPYYLRETVDRHSVPVENSRGVYEIRFGTFAPVHS